MTVEGEGFARGGSTLEAAGVGFTYGGARTEAVSGVTVAICPGTLTSLLGPNGSGKSTLLKLLAGGLEPAEGRVALDGRDLNRWPPRALAQRLGVVPQIEHVPFPVTVHDLVAMGRYPHLGPWRSPGPADRDAIAGALERCGVGPLSDRPFQSLSGGERQRVRIARALAQNPRVLLLDEPTASLDMRYEMSIFRLLDRLRTDEAVSVLVVTHNVNLAARFSDRVMLMKDGRVAFDGVPEEVVTPDCIQAVYEWPALVVQQVFAEGSAPQVFPR